MRRVARTRLREVRSRRDQRPRRRCRRLGRLPLLRWARGVQGGASSDLRCLFRERALLVGGGATPTAWSDRGAAGVGAVRSGRGVTGLEAAGAAPGVAVATL
jgi:hypothetical protein